MNDPRRLLDTADDFERALLSSAKRDVGSRAAASRCVAAVGASLVLTKAGAASGASFLFPVLKAGAVGAALGLLAGGASLGLSHEEPALKASSAARAQPARAPSSRVGSRNEPAATPVAPDEAEAAHTAAFPDEIAVAQAGTATPSARRPLDPSGSGQRPLPEARDAPDRLLEREVFWLDQAREALASANAQRAAQALDGYEREFPRGVLQPEALLLRVQALIVAGRRAEADSLGRRFLATHPAAAHARKLSQLLEPGQPPQ